MNRVQVVGANGGGVAYSRGRVIPWKKRIDAGFKQKGGGGDLFDDLSQGMFGIKQTKRKKLTGKQRQKKLQEYRDYRKNLHPPRKQKGGWFARGFTGFSGTTRGKNLEIENRRLQKERERKRKQKGGDLFDDLSKGMFGIEQKRGKKKRKPAIIHISATSYPQKGGGGKYGGFKGFFENPFHVREKLGVGNKGKKQKGGVLGLGKLEKWYGGKSKKEQEEIDAWTAKNL
jgi:hypothetical protein